MFRGDGNATAPVFPQKLGVRRNPRAIPFLVPLPTIQPLAFMPSATWSVQPVALLTLVIRSYMLPSLYETKARWTPVEVFFDYPTMVPDALIAWATL